MTKCSDFKSQRKRIQAEILIASPSRNTENFNGIWTEPQKNDPDTRTNSQGQKQGEQGLKARKTQGRSRAPWVPWSKEQLELEVGRSTGVKSQEILQEGDSLSGPALESWGSCMGQGGNALGNHRGSHRGGGSGAVNRCLPRPKAREEVKNWEHSHSKSFLSRRVFRVPLFQCPK